MFFAAIIILFIFSTPIVNAQESQWDATFYSRDNLSGTTVKQKYDHLNFSWGPGSPHPSIPHDNFSAVFEKNMVVNQPGKFLFTGLADDGIRIYVDGKKRVDHWKNGVNKINHEIYLTEGSHTIKVEYYDNKYSATLKLDLVELTEPYPANSWSGTFYGFQDFSGVKVEESFADLSFSWGAGSPHPTIPVDNFSAVFNRSITVNKSGMYRLSGLSDDGIRIYIDGKKRVDLWNTGVNMVDEVIYLTEGTHQFKVEYYDNKYSATLRLKLEEVPEQIATDKWNATFYPSSDFSGVPILETHDSLNFAWGAGSPHPSIPVDNFSAVFQKNLVVDKQGKYKITGLADDGIRIYIDGKKVIDFWNDGVNRLDHEVYLTQGTHNIKVEYYDRKWSATIKVDLTEVDENIGKWEASFYPTVNLTGIPINQFFDELNFSWGQGSPHPTIPSDKFSASFVKKINLQAETTFQLEGRADDGIRIYIDGQLYVDQWKNGVNDFNRLVTLAAGEHTIKVDYYDNLYSATLRVKMNEVDIPVDKWKATYYPTVNMSGTPVSEYVNNLSFSWGQGSPHPSIPADNFSATFERSIYIETPGKFRLSGLADDGIRIYVDGVKQVEMWQDGVNRYSKDITLQAGYHTFKIEYYDSKYSATLTFDISEVGIKQFSNYTNYNTTFSEALNLQLTKGNPQTDKKYDAYVRSDALTVTGTSPTFGYVNGVGWNVRGNPVNGWILGKLTDKERVTIYSSVKGSDGYTWYKILYNRSWVNASPEDTSYYLNPKNFAPNTKSYFQFLKLSESAGLDVSEVNTKILDSRKGILAGKAASFINAGQQFKVNEIYLIAHALLETGNGASELATGIKVKRKVDNQGNPIYASNGHVEVDVLDPKATNYDAIVYNMYGIGAYDNCAKVCGARMAFNEGWNTPDKAIIGGAKFVAESYIHVGQDTLYKMKWNPAKPATHQYATDIGWAVKQTTRIFDLYSLLESYTITFDVPVYK
ncbi:PA14 domain-containing protein [Bacillus sp. FJAT-27251]|uniref:PA14 domain-containing protein n=1 Tax=Bacillus sp. FJAT-27251 TaxID=1684142 RepID=UPI0006A79A0E|nr:PA14 domain-containing protein [Bacillus sp. FJAT-27251]